MSTPFTSALVAAVAVAVTVPIGLAGPARALPVGAAPAVTWQSGPAVHTSDGQVVTLPRSVPRGAQVLGKRHGEWIVATPGDEAQVLAVRDGHVRTVWEHVYDESATSYTLVEGRDQVVEWNYTRGTTTYGVVFDLHGEELATRGWNGYASVLAADRHGVLVSGRKQTVRWAPGGTAVPVAPRASFADPAHDLLFVFGDEGAGPTALSAPGTPAWTARFDPEAVSPDGTWVAGVTYSAQPKLQLRRLADGSLAPVPALKLDADPIMVGGSHVQLTWESDDSVVAVVRSARGRSVVRCTLDGACERATAWVKGQGLGFPA
jgi:hypothetical protein